MALSGVEQRICRWASQTLLLALAVLVQARVLAQPQTPVDPAGQAVGEVTRDVGRFLIGPQYRESHVNPYLSCVEIYEEMVRLLPYTYNYKPDFYDDPRNAFIGLLGFEFAPAFYAWGYTALDGYSERRDIAETNMRVDALRRASASQDCWVRQ